MLTKDVVGTGTSASDGAFESSADEDESVIDQGGFLDERFYAWHILLEAIERQTSTSDAGRRRVRNRVVTLIHEADEAGLGKNSLIVELADMAAALVMRIHDDPFDALVRVHREMLALWVAPAQGAADGCTTQPARS